MKEKLEYQHIYPEDEKFGEEIGEAIANLNLENDADKKIYYDNLEKFIVKYEGSHNESYYDDAPKIKYNPNHKTGNRTAGIGYNLDKGGKRGSKKEFDKILEDDIADFHQVYEGKIKLTDSQIKKLFKDSVKIAEEQVREIYKNHDDLKVLDNLNPIGKFILTELAFNSPSLLKNSKSFRKYFAETMKNPNICSIGAMKWEIIRRTNKDGSPGYQRRNSARLALLNILEKYLKLTHKSLPKTIIPGETYIPRDMPGKPVTDSGYFIWRTMLDDSVRTSHAEREGRIYRHDDSNNQPESEPGCRCKKECLTEEVLKRINEKAEYFEGEATANIKQAPQFDLRDEANANIKHLDYFVKEGEVVIMTNLDHDIELLKSQINLSHYALINEKTEMIGNDNMPYQMVLYRKFKVIEPGSLDFITKLSREKFKIFS